MRCELCTLTDFSKSGLFVSTAVTSNSEWPKHFFKLNHHYEIIHDRAWHPEDFLKFSLLDMSTVHVKCDNTSWLRDFTVLRPNVDSYGWSLSTMLMEPEQ